MVQVTVQVVLGTVVLIRPRNTEVCVGNLNCKYLEPTVLLN